MTKVLTVKNTSVSVIQVGDEDFLSLTDIAKFKSDEPFIVVCNWMRNRNTIEYLGIWESLYNPHFTPLEFDRVRKEAELNAFTMSPSKWIETTGAVGIVTKSGRYGGTYAHKDIAFKFASWISVEFELYVAKEFQRLKGQEQAQLGWSVKRELSKLNYHIHTDAIKQNLIPPELRPRQKSFVYAEEGRSLSRTYRVFASKNSRQPKAQVCAANLVSTTIAGAIGRGRLRHYATINQLICLSNLENLNAVFIQKGMPQAERLTELNKIAIQQMKVLEAVEDRKLLK